MSRLSVASPVVFLLSKEKRRRWQVCFLRVSDAPHTHTYIHRVANEFRFVLFFFCMHSWNPGMAGLRKG